MQFKKQENFDSLASSARLYESYGFPDLNGQQGNATGEVYVTCPAWQGEVTISKQALAKLYFPHLKKKQAVRKLRQWINLNSQLSEELKRMGCRKQSRFYNPNQMEAIINILGEPNVEI